MGKMKFEARLTTVLQRAASRLAQRMKRAEFQGRLKEYLHRIGLAGELEDELSGGKFGAVCQRAENILQRKISRARQKGYLKEYLKYVNMLDLLLPTKPLGKVSLTILPGLKGAARSGNRPKAFYPPPRLTLVK
ncbi:MAG: hypothetical protein IJ849_03895 [Selenomonadaceae bacterium]|nr:hypothetical protein [Selenomonadaceae bacterium]